MENEAVVQVCKNGNHWEIHDLRLKKIMARCDTELYALTIAGMMEEFLVKDRKDMVNLDARIANLPPNHDLELGIAIKIAVKAHDGQYRRNGEPYIMHPFRVMLDVSDRVERVVAILHDVLEDCPSIRPIDLINDGISDAAVVACEMLNKKNFPDYATYIDNIAQFGYPAFNVKLADLRDNMGVRDLKNVDENKTKYQKAYNTLIRSLQ